MILIGFLEKTIEQYSLSEKFKCLLRLFFYFLKFIISAKAFEKKIYGNAILGKLPCLLILSWYFYPYPILQHLWYNNINNHLTVIKTIIFYVKMKKRLRKTFFIYLLQLFYYYGLWYFYIFKENFILPIKNNKKYTFRKNIFIADVKNIFSMPISFYRYKNEYFENYC